MPVTKKYSLRNVLAAAEYYYSKTKQRITFEYILFADVNDRDEDIHQIVRMAKKIPCKINIIPFHSIAFTGTDGYGTTLRPTSRPRMEKFVEQLRACNVSVFVRGSAGEDIQAACGQLAIESKRIRTVHQRRIARENTTSVSLPPLVLQ
jgi:23S rRNA (adenine2503-C2)-methyltransferase